jgi:hypothetical protein
LATTTILITGTNRALRSFKVNGADLLLGWLQSKEVY